MLIAVIACSEIVLPVVFLTTYVAPVEIAAWPIEAVVNPEVAGPIKARGAIKQPVKVTPTATIKHNLFIIVSLLLNLIVFTDKKKGANK